MKIFEFIGGIDEKNTSFLTHKAAKKYIKAIQGSTEQKDISSKFNKSSKELVAVLKSLIELNPYLRSSASELLANPVFDSIRVPQVEITASQPISLKCDQTDAFNYKKGKDMMFKDMEDIRETIISEIKKVKSQNKEFVKL